jgi:hypothetical protein
MKSLARCFACRRKTTRGLRFAGLRYCPACAEDLLTIRLSDQTALLADLSLKADGYVLADQDAT